MIGVMADTHDNCDAIRKAIRLFTSLPCELVLHAGDVVAPFAARELENLHCPVKAVFGNCDGERQGLTKVFLPFGEIHEPPLSFMYGQLCIFVTHIHTSIPSALTSCTPDVVVFGHTHKPEMRRKGKTLFLNPGETGGWVSGKCTVALLDPETLTAEMISL